MKISTKSELNMDRSVIFLGVVPLMFLLVIPYGDALRSGACNPFFVNSYCDSKNNFLCFNGKCISKYKYCDGRNDCGDNSDENYCSRRGSCPNSGSILMTECPGSDRCIPVDWFCDGIQDCYTGYDGQRHDESDQSCTTEKRKRSMPMTLALNWMKEQKTSKLGTQTWGSTVDKTAVALFLAGNLSTNGSESLRKELAYELSIQLLSRLSERKLREIPSTDLASYSNAFLVTCLDPRKFHGLDIVRELRSRVDAQNYTNPYVLLSLCNAGETITESDKMKLIDVFWSRRRVFWTDVQAVAVMALACANKQPGNDVDSETLRELTMELKNHQYSNGTVENLQTTALVMQALYSAEPEEDPDNFNENSAKDWLLSMQEVDGSFGSLMNTYYVLPVLNCRSLVNISSEYCVSARVNETSALDALSIRSGTKIRVHYTLWFGNDKDLERKLALRVPANMSFYGIMEIASEIDSRYRFEYVVKNRKPYINAVSGIQDNPEKGKFWFLYVIRNGTASPSQDSPADVIPKHGEHFVMWYRTGSWID